MVDRKPERRPAPHIPSVINFGRAEQFRAAEKISIKRINETRDIERRRVAIAAGAEDPAFETDLASLRLRLAIENERKHRGISQNSNSRQTGRKHTRQRPAGS